MATFVLVHGAWHGGWCYGRVAKKLRAAGHEVFTPTHTGVGERSHLAAGTEVNLSLHVKDVCQVIEYEGLKDVILCGHSYGGMVITGVAAALGERIKSLVYLDAFVPEDGQSLFSLAPGELVLQFMDLAKAAGGRIPPIPAEAFAVNAGDAAWVNATCVPQAIATFAEGVKLTGKEKQVKNRTYILATGYDMHVFDQFHTKLKDNAAWKVRTVPCGHDVMLDKPDDLTKLLLEEVDR
jgi:pimeloyl-ACP methyl ester carboxylesterase